MNKEIFGKFLAQTRKEAGMTQQALAQQLHVTNTAVSKWERGLSYPDLDLFEPLAQALHLSISELMACRKSAGNETPADPMEGHVRSLLDILKDTTHRHRRQALSLVGIFLLILALTSAVVYYFSVLSVRETCYAELVGKQFDEGGQYIFIEKDTHLLRLACPDRALYDTLDADSNRLYRLEYHYNRNTFRGTLDFCQAPSENAYLGTPSNAAGSAWVMGHDLFGFCDVVQKIEYVMEDPIRKGNYLYTFRFHYQKPVNEKVPGSPVLEIDILRVENCRAALPYDYDNDGILELFVLTRYEEAPYRLYDLESGKLVSRFVEEIPAQVLESLTIMASA